MPFFEQLKYERQLRGWSQAELATRIGSDPKTISRWERGETLPTPQLRKKLLELLGKNAEELGLIGEETKTKNEQQDLPHNVTYLNAVNSPPVITPPPLQSSAPSPARQTPASPIEIVTHRDLKAKHLLVTRSEDTHGFTQRSVFREDRGEAPSVGNFYGREEERVELKQWIVDDHCRLVAVLGVGGVGKTAIAAKLVEQIKHEFTHIFWRSLQNAPPVEYILKSCIQFLSDQYQVDLPDDFDSQLALLISYLREHRCLLVLDNAESVLQAGQRAGHYREGYEEYGTLFERIGEVQHHSCLLLTSREKPREVARLEGNASLVRALRLYGIGQEACREILRDKSLFGTDEVWSALIHLYAGNPLALKLVSESVREVFRGNIARFLEGGEAVFGDIHDLLDQQFRRLSMQEQEILYWLAIEREPVSLEELQQESVRSLSRGILVEALDSLRRRSMIESSDTERFTLQPVIMEYVTDRLVRQISEELNTGTLTLFESHALMKAQSKYYVRDSQVRVILKPIAEALLRGLGKDASEKRLKTILKNLGETHPQKPVYAAGNILNLLIYLKADLRGANFSHLVVWQAYLRDTTLPDVNFTSADLTRSVFMDTFGSVLSVTFSPNGNLLAAGTGSGEIRIWQAADGVPVLTRQGHTDWVWSVAFSPDGRTLASGSSDQTIRLWDITTGNCLHILHGHSHRVRSVAFSPNGQILASASEDQTIRLWDASSGQCLVVLHGHSNPVRSIAFHPDGNTLVSGSDDRTVRLWDVATGNCLSTLHGHESQIWSIAFSPNGMMVASGSDDQTVRLWDVITGNCIKILRGHSNWICSIAFSPDGSLLVSGSGDRTVRLWEVDAGKCVNVLQGHMNWAISVAFSPEGGILASGSHDQTIRLWETKTGKCLNILQGHSTWIRSVAFSPDGRVLASGDRAVRMWDVSTGNRLYTLQGHSSWIRSVAFSPDGRIIASGSDDQTARLWNVRTGQLLSILQGHTNRVKSVAFSPDGRIVASGSDDQTVRLWQVRSGHHMRTLHGHTNRIRSVAFNPDGLVLASGSDDQTVCLWNTQTGQLLNTLQGHNNRVWSVAFSPDGRILATGSEDWTVRLWEISTGQCLYILQGHSNPVWSIVFSPNGRVIASSSEDQSVRLWDVNTGSCLHTLQGHSNPIWTIAFNSNGRVLASGSHDWTVRIWDVGSGRCLHVLQEHSNPVWSVAFNPDGVLASGSDDGTIRLWDGQTGACRKTLKSDKPYERMNITNIVGLTEAQKATLKELGAIEDDE